MKLPNITVLSKCIIKNTNSENEMCKQYFKLLVSKDKPEELILVVTKYVLTDRSRLYLNFKALRTFRGKILYMQIFSIKMDTIMQAQKLLTINNKYLK